MEIDPRESGQGMVEYGLIIALVAVAVIVALVALGGGLGTLFNNVANTVEANPG
jgi:pilus assembly protein Flp/PilA